MGRRQEPRVEIDLPVTVHGTDAQGKPFAQSAHTLEVSQIGLRLRGIYCLKAAGEVVLVAHKGRRAKYRAIWIGAPGTEWDGQIGLRRIKEEKFIFSVELPASAWDAFETEAPPPPPGALVEASGAASVKPIPLTPQASRESKGAAERRRFARYPCSGEVSMSSAGTPGAARGRISDLSLGGCYVEMLEPFPAHSTVIMDFAINQKKFRAEAEVRTTHPQMGMCVQFRRMTAQDGYALQQIIRDLAGPAQFAASPAAPANVTPATSTAPPHIGVVDELLRWFALHDILSRDEFQRILQSTPSALKDRK